jgi:hypothetical protein
MNDRDVLPLADAQLLGHHARRTRLVRVTVLVALAAALAYGGSALPLRPKSVHAGPAGRATVVVLDVSGSVGGQAVPRVEKLLASLGSTGDAGAGLVLFSDSAYIAVPPSARAAELLSYASYYRRPSAAQRQPLWFSATYVPEGQTLTYAHLPWRLTFSGGTAISTGLAMARTALRRAHIGAAEVVLVSDFYDAVSDQPRLRHELRTYAETPGVALSTMTLPQASASGLASFRRDAAPKGDAYRPPTDHPSKASHAAARFSAPLSFSFLLAVCLVLVALAADELLGPVFSWGDGRSS